MPELIKSAAAFIYPVGAYCFRAGIPQAWGIDKSAQLPYIPFAMLFDPILASPLMVPVGGQMARDEIAYVEYANA